MAIFSMFRSIVEKLKPKCSNSAKVADAELEHYAHPSGDSHSNHNHLAGDEYGIPQTADQVPPLPLAEDCRSNPNHHAVVQPENPPNAPHAQGQQDQLTPLVNGQLGTPRRVPTRTTDVERAGGDEPARRTIFHERVADLCPSVAPMLMSAAPVLLLNKPDLMSPQLSAWYVNLAFIGLGGGTWVLILHISRKPSTKTACLKLLAAAVGIMSIIADLFILSSAYVQPKNFLVLVSVTAFFPVVVYYSIKKVLVMVTPEGTGAVAGA